MTLKNMIKRLTWNYNKNEESNVYKLFSIIATEVETLKKVFQKIESWRGIQNAEGKALDLIGEDLRQERKGMTDEQYRPMLRFQTAVNRSNVDINNVNIALKSITEGEFVRLYEGYNHERYQEPASIIAELKRLYPKTPFREMENIIAAGVRLTWEVKEKEEMPLHLAIHADSVKQITLDNEKPSDVSLSILLTLALYPRSATEDYLQTYYPSAISAVMIDVTGIGIQKLKIYEMEVI